MSPPQVPNTDQAGAELVTITLTVERDELTEIMRGVVQRMSVARSNMLDENLSGEQITRWVMMYQTCWNAYQKLRYAGAAHTPDPNPVSVKALPSPAPEGDEFDYLSQEV